MPPFQGRLPQVSAPPPCPTHYTLQDSSPTFLEKRLIQGSKIHICGELWPGDLGQFLPAGLFALYSKHVSDEKGLPSSEAHLC